MRLEKSIAILELIFARIGAQVHGLTELKFDETAQQPEPL